MGNFAVRRWILLLYDHFFLRKMAELYGTVGQSGFFLIWAIVTGLVTGVAVILIRIAAAELEAFTGSFPRSFAYLCVLFFAPVLGMTLSWFIKKKLSHSNSSADMTLLIKAIRQRKPELIKLETLSHIIASPLTAGLGASAGLTTPSVLTGASVGANLGKFLHIAPDRTVQLMTCGTAAGIASIFGSPISGVLFAVEVLLPRMSVGELVPVLLSAAGATVIAQLFLQNTPFFQLLCRSWEIQALPYYLVLGVLSAFVGIFMIRSNRRISSLMETKIGNDRMRLLTGALAVSGIVFLFPEISGEGIKGIQLLCVNHTLAGVLPGWLTGWADNPFIPVILFGLLLCLFKIVATSLTLSCGGSGGFFAPTLFAGAFFGFSMKILFDRLHWGHLHDTNFIALGMCGVFASAFRAPLTGIFLVVEMSGSYLLMIPLILVAAISYFITAFLENASIYTDAVEEEPSVSAGFSNLKKTMDTDCTVLSPGKKVNWEILLGSSQEEHFPVLDSKGYLLGVIFRSTVERCVARGDAGAFPETLMQFPKVTVRSREKISVILAAMRIFSMNRLPVLDSRKRFRGFVSVEVKEK